MDKKDGMFQNHPETNGPRAFYLSLATALLVTGSRWNWRAGQGTGVGVIGSILCRL